MKSKSKAKPAKHMDVAQDKKLIAKMIKKSEAKDKKEDKAMMRSMLAAKAGKALPKLVKGKKASSPKGFAENIKRESMLGDKKKQAVKIAYKEAERGKRKGK